MKELWKTISNHPDYMISNFGRCKSLKFGKERILKPIQNKQFDKDMYSKYILCTNNERPKQLYVHRLVAEHFLLNPSNLPEVNHLDHNKQNNHIKNLEWVSRIQNMAHAYKNLQLIFLKPKPVFEYDLQNNLIKEYSSIYQAGKANGVTPMGLAYIIKNSGKKQTTRKSKITNKIFRYEKISNQ